VQTLLRIDRDDDGLAIESRADPLTRLEKQVTGRLATRAREAVVSVVPAVLAPVERVDDLD
jgi:hypothetical protein